MVVLTLLSFKSLIVTLNIRDGSIPIPDSRICQFSDSRIGRLILIPQQRNNNRIYLLCVHCRDFDLFYWSMQQGAALTSLWSFSDGGLIREAATIAIDILRYAERWRCNCNLFQHVFSGGNCYLYPVAIAYAKRWRLDRYWVYNLFICLLFHWNKYFCDLLIMLRFN